MTLRLSPRSSWIDEGAWRRATRRSKSTAPAAAPGPVRSRRRWRSGAPAGARWLLLCAATPCVDARAADDAATAPPETTAIAEQRLVPYRAAVFAACGVDLPMTVDWATFDTPGEPDRRTDRGLVAWSCSRVHDTLVQFCAEPSRREAVTRKLTGLRCRGAREADAWSLRDGELVVEIRSISAFSVGGVNPLEHWLESEL